MPCYHPLEVPRKGFVDLRQQVACGQCIGCRIDRRRAWAARCMHESHYHERKCFLTLTYKDASIPTGGTLVPEDLRLFFRRLRKAIRPVKVRYFACGEYGDTTRRPHYHALLFGWDFPDKVRFMKGGSDPQFTSSQLTALWPHGTHLISALTYERANYVAGYVMKKINGKAALMHYAVIDPATGEIVAQRHPEFVRMSRRPGIAAKWYEDFGGEVFPDDFVVVRGSEHPVPRYYLKKFKADQPLLAASVIERRVSRAQERGFTRTPERLRARETVAAAKSNLRRRNAE